MFLKFNETTINLDRVDHFFMNEDNSELIFIQDQHSVTIKFISKKSCSITYNEIIDSKRFIVMRFPEGEMTSWN